jgi:hypothetical protein
MNITVNPKPMLRMAILTTGREKLALFLESILRAIKNSVFKEMLFGYKCTQTIGK